MEIKEAKQRVVIAKPVASRPNTCSGFQFFSELLAGAINDSSAPPPLPIGRSETAVSAAIRPKTVRFKSTFNRHPAGPVSSSPAEIPETEKPTLLYKPLTKLVSKSTVSLLAKMGNFSQRSINESGTKHPQLNSNLELVDIHKTVVIPSEASKPTAQLADSDRPSCDAYNWRKYGQNQVKESEYPRSYYKCTSPNCPVKRMVERSIDGQISEIVYKGEHNHSTPKPQRRNIWDGTEIDRNEKVGSSSNQVSEKNEGCESRVENHNGIVGGGVMSGGFRRGKGVRPYDLAVTDNSCGPGRECGVGSKGTEVEDDEEPRSKRRKAENQSGESGISGENLQSQGISVQNPIDSVILDDGYRWRKYGQKIVKGNPYPRSYYRCTSPKCNVRRHVERASDDSKAYITTYEGKHNHEMPLRNTANPIPSDADPQAQTSKRRTS